MTQLYTSSQAGTRDSLPQPAHFATETIANGKVYVGTRTALVAYGLFPSISVTSGSAQTATVGTTLPVQLQVKSLDPYSGQIMPGVNVTFSDSGKGGVFSNPTAVTDANGLASTTYKLPTKTGTYSIAATSPGFGTGFFTESALTGSPSMLSRFGGNLQTAPVTTTLPVLLSARVTDQYGNFVQGVPVSFTDGTAGGSFSPSAPQLTDSKGVVNVSYTASTKAGKVSITVSAPNLHSQIFTETITAAVPSAIAVVSGNNQTAAVSTPLPLPLKVKVTDQYGNAVSGATVTYADGGAGGSYSANPVVTDSTGSASTTYTTPATATTITVTASASGVPTPASFQEAAQ